MTPLPLPYLSLSFETIEARLWAKETVDNVFTEMTPKSASLDYNHWTDMVTINENVEFISTRSQLRPRRHTVSSTSSSMTTVSTSSISSEPTNDQCNDVLLEEEDQQRNSTSATSSESLEPPSPRRLSRRSSITSSLKRRLTLDESTSIHVRRLFLSEQLQKEQKAHSMWQDTLHEYLLDPAFQIPAPRYTVDSPRLAHCIVSELLSTEETYLGHLSIFNQAFIEPFLQRFQNRNMAQDLQTIFSHFPHLISLSSTLVRSWRRTIEQQACCMNDDYNKIMGNEQHQGIGRAFCDLENDFKVYIYYAVHYAKAQKCIAKMEQKPSYQQWMHSVLQNNELGRMELADYLISPIQRITRYCLLIKDLRKHTDGYNMGLEKTLKYLTALAVAMNNCQQ